jgi:hypothetical protein
MLERLRATYLGAAHVVVSLALLIEDRSLLLGAHCVFRPLFALVCRRGVLKVAK